MYSVLTSKLRFLSALHRVSASERWRTLAYRKDKFYKVLTTLDITLFMMNPVIKPFFGQLD